MNPLLGQVSESAQAMARPGSWCSVRLTVISSGSEGGIPGNMKAQETGGGFTDLLTYTPSQFCNRFKMTGWMATLSEEEARAKYPREITELSPLFTEEANTAHIWVNITKKQPQLITLSAWHPRVIFKSTLAASFCGPLHRAAWSRQWCSLEDVAVWKGELCPAQARIIHSRHMCNAGETGANNWASCQQATGIAFDILIVSWSVSHVGSITVIADCTSVNLFESLLMSVWVREKPDITRDLNWAWLLLFPFSCRRTRELTNANNC